MSDARVIVALDFSERKQLFNLVDQLEPTLCKLKVGKELFTSFGPELVQTLAGRGFDIFLDLKFHDIPTTVAKACRAAADLGVWMTNVHAQGGHRMLEAAREMIDRNSSPMKLIAVTVLTSMAEEDLQAIGVHSKPKDYALGLAKLAHEAGLDGIVCSAQEAAVMKSQFGQNFILVTPGIRPQGSSADDQRRIVTPREACERGSDYLVIGRPVTQSADPVGVLREINSEILN